MADMPSRRDTFLLNRGFYYNPGKAVTAAVPASLPGLPAEAVGTRFVQLMHAGWDQHKSLTTELYSQCRDTDQPSAALVRDLEQRGLLDETLVIWGGEFGRTPFIQGDINNRPRWGRDHHPYAFTVWLAGGGIRPGLTYGASDELGFNAVDNRVHVHDLQATLLHQLGINHEQLTYRFQGRQFRLTDVHGQVVKDILG